MTAPAIVPHGGALCLKSCRQRVAIGSGRVLQQQLQQQRKYSSSSSRRRARPHEAGSAAWIRANGGYSNSLSRSCYTFSGQSTIAWSRPPPTPAGHCGMVRRFTGPSLTRASPAKAASPPSTAPIEEGKELKQAAAPIVAERGGGGEVGEGGTVVPRPSLEQLRVLFMHSAVPFIGFGFVDNLVMIQAGDLIDNTIGVKFGLATLSAAALGQVVSDTSGVLFGGYVESMATKLGLPIPVISAAQHRLRITQIVATAGAAIGVIAGCLLGMCSLLFIDTTTKEREKKQRELDTLFTALLDHGHEMISASRCSLFFVDEEKQELWSKVATTHDGTLVTHKLITVPMGKGVVGEAVRTKQVIHVKDTAKDNRFYAKIDQSLKTSTYNLIAVPVMSPDGNGKVLAVIEMMNKVNGGTFDDADIKLCKMLAHHVAVFITAAA